METGPGDLDGGADVPQSRAQPTPQAFQTHLFSSLTLASLETVELCRDEILDHPHFHNLGPATSKRCAYAQLPASIKFSCSSRDFAKSDHYLRRPNAVNRLQYRSGKSCCSWRTNLKFVHYKELRRLLGHALSDTDIHAISIGVPSQVDQMIRWLLIVSGTLIVAAVLFGLWIIFYVFGGDTGHIRYTVHATFVDGGNTYEGDAVWELRISKARISHDMTTSVRGEAIPLLSPGGRNLFMLRAPASGYSNPTYGGYPLLCVPGNPRTYLEKLHLMEDVFTGPCMVTERQDSPMVIEITDLLDPASIRIVPYTFSTTAPVRVCA